MSSLQCALYTSSSALLNRAFGQRILNEFHIRSFSFISSVLFMAASISSSAIAIRLQAWASPSGISIIQYHQLCVAVVTVGFSEQPLSLCFDYAIRLEGSCAIAVWAMLVCSTMLEFRVLNCVMPKFTIFYPVHSITSSWHLPQLIRATSFRA